MHFTNKVYVQTKKVFTHKIVALNKSSNFKFVVILNCKIKGMFVPQFFFQTLCFLYDSKIELLFIISVLYKPKQQLFVPTSMLNFWHSSQSVSDHEIYRSWIFYLHKVMLMSKWRKLFAFTVKSAENAEINTCRLSLFVIKFKLIYSLY